MRKKSGCCTRGTGLAVSLLGQGGGHLWHVCEHGQGRDLELKPSLLSGIAILSLILSFFSPLDEASSIRLRLVFWHLVVQGKAHKAEQGRWPVMFRRRCASVVLEAPRTYVFL